MDEDDLDEFLDAFDPALEDDTDDETTTSEPKMNGGDSASKEKNAIAASVNALMLDEDEDLLDPTLQSIIQNKTLKWIFVGGKGGVGKTTTSCSVGALLSKTRKSCLIISTDPAHNLSDAFRQKFGPAPVRVNGFKNLFCMEIDPLVQKKAMDVALANSTASSSGSSQQQGMLKGMQDMMKDLSGSIPGIDEAMSFAELMKSVDTMEYDVIVFDTAPTGHTLRLLSFPKTLEKTMGKLLGLKSKFGGMLNMVTQMMAAQGLGNASGAGVNAIVGKLEQTMEVVRRVNAQFKDPKLTTFVCVCIPEFLSLFETERLVQELAKFEIDTHCIVVNQVLPIDAGLEVLKARQRMQRKYLEQIYDLYEQFKIVEMPMLKEEVRGPEAIKRFASYLVEPYEPSEKRCSAAAAVQKLQDLEAFLLQRSEGRKLLEEFRAKSGTPRRR